MTAPRPSDSEPCALWGVCDQPKGHDGPHTSTVENAARLADCECCGPDARCTCRRPGYHQYPHKDFCAVNSLHPSDSERTPRTDDLAWLQDRIEWLRSLDAEAAAAIEAESERVSLDGPGLYRTVWQETWSASGLMPMRQWEQLTEIEQAVWRRAAARLSPSTGTPEAGE